MTDRDQPSLYLRQRIMSQKPLHPVFNAVWWSVTDIEKSKKSAVTDVPCSQRAGVLGKVCLLSSLSGDMEAHSHFEGIWRVSKRKNTELCTFYCFLSKWFWSETMNMKKYSSFFCLTSHFVLTLYYEFGEVNSVEVKCLYKASALRGHDNNMSSASMPVNNLFAPVV